eukprot:28491-Rhodomonas_salina.1
MDATLPVVGSRDEHAMLMCKGHSDLAALISEIKVTVNNATVKLDLLENQVSSARVLRACYAMSSTGIAYGAMRCLVLSSRISLRLCYAMCGTELRYAAMRCAVLSYRMLLLGAATRGRVLSRCCSRPRTGTYTVPTRYLHGTYT